MLARLPDCGADARAAPQGPELLASHPVIQAANGALNLAFDLVSHALRLELGLTNRFPDSFLRRSLDDLRGTDHPVLVYGVLPSRHAALFSRIEVLQKCALIQIEPNRVPVTILAHA